jgi:hypothetical protein
MAGFLKIVVATIAVVIGFVIALKLLGLVFTLLAITLWFVKMAIYLGVFLLLCYGVYRLIVSREPRPHG